MWHRVFYLIARAVLQVLFRILFHVKAVGTEYLPKHDGYIVASNHRSNCDPVFVGIFVKPVLTFMAKVELFQTPFVGMIIKCLDAFPVERGKGDTKAVDFAVRSVREGKVLAMFPEGTRSEDGKLQRAKSGCAMIAGATGATVVPVAICFAEKLRFRTHVTVRFGPPISREELGIDISSPHTLKRASRLIMERIGELLEEGVR